MKGMHFLLVCALLLIYTSVPQIICTSYEIEVNKIGDEVKIDCTESYKSLDGVTPNHWVLTDLTAIDKNYKSDDISIEENGWQLKIRNFGNHHIGDYYCVLTQDSDNSYLYFKSVVFLTKQSTWDEFRTETIVGCTAAAICLVVMVGLCLVWHYRWRPVPQDIVAINRDYDTATGYADQEKGHVNINYADMHHSTEDIRNTRF